MRADVISTRPAFLKPDDSYDLLRPVRYMIGEEAHLLEKLQLRRLTGVERVISDKDISAAEKTHEILASVTNEMVAVIQKIDWVDLDRLDECLGFFTEHGPLTGQTD